MDPKTQHLERALGLKGAAAVLENEGIGALRKLLKRGGKTEKRLAKPVKKAAVKKEELEAEEGDEVLEGLQRVAAAIDDLQDIVDAVSNGADADVDMQDDDEDEEDKDLEEALPDEVENTGDAADAMDILLEGLVEAQAALDEEMQKLLKAFGVAKNNQGKLANAIKSLEKRLLRIEKQVGSRPRAASSAGETRLELDETTLKALGLGESRKAHPMYPGMFVEGGE